MSLKKNHLRLLLLLHCFLLIAGRAEAAGDRPSYEWLIKPRFHRAEYFENGVGWVQEKEDGPWSLLDKNGEVVFDGFIAAEFVSRFSKDTGLARFTAYSGQRGYVNKSGKVVIPPQYDEAERFRDGVAAVGKKTGGELRYGVIDHSGKIVLPLTYERVEVCHRNLFVVARGKKWAFIDASGKALTEFVFSRPMTTTTSEFKGFPPNIRPARLLDAKAGLIDVRGGWLFPPVYSAVYQPGEGLIALAKDGKVGFVDTSGKTVIDFQFGRGYGYTFSEGLALVSSWEKGRPFRGVIDRTGKLLFKFEGSPLCPFANGLFLVLDKNQRAGLIDRQGKYEPLPWTLDIGSGIGFDEGVLLVRSRLSGRYGYLKINRK